MVFSLIRLRATTTLTTAVLLWSVTCAHATTGTVVYDADYVSQFGTTGSADSEFQGAEHISVAPDGSLYVTDRYNQRVQVFDRDGVYVTKFGVGGVANGQSAKKLDGQRRPLPLYAGFGCWGNMANE